MRDKQVQDFAFSKDGEVGRYCRFVLGFYTEQASLCPEIIELVVFSERSKETGQDSIQNICSKHFQLDSPKKFSV